MGTLKQHTQGQPSKTERGRPSGRRIKNGDTVCSSRRPKKRVCYLHKRRKADEKKRETAELRSCVKVEVARVPTLPASLSGTFPLEGRMS